MGDVITRFKLETTQYDSKLRDATNGLKEVIHQTELAGNDFKEFSSRAIESARALGQQATGATNAKDKVKELVSSYNEMAKTYNLMSDAMKKSEGGKALAASLEQLQQRIKDAKAEMNATPGILDNLASKFTVNIDAIKLFNVGLQAAEGVLNVAKDAFFKNEEQLDEWGRIVESSKSLYSGFLDALNTGDISGYLNRIGEITKAAQNAYNALDALNTFNAFNQVNVEKTRTGMTESIADYRSGQGSKEQVKSAGEAYQKELRERQKLERKAYLEAIKKVAAERGVNGQDLITALSGSYGSYESLKALPMSGTRMKFTPGGMFGGSTAYEEAYPVNRQEKLGAALRKLNDTELQSLQALGAQAERTGNEIAQVDKQLTRVLNGRQPGLSGGSGGGSGGSSTKKVPTLEEFWLQMTKNDMKLQDQKAAGDLVKDMPSPYQMMFDEIKKQYLDKKDFDYGKDISKEWKVDSKGNLTNKPETRVQESMARDLNKFTGYAEKTLGGVSNIVGGLSQLGVEIPKGLQDVLGGIQGITSIVTGIASLVAMIEALTTVQTTESTIKSIPVIGWALAGGGIVHAASGYEVPGNYYSGDQVPALLNSGELVLNKSQTNALSNALQGNGMQNLKLRTEVSGRNLIVVIENDLKARGKGQLATFKG